MYTAGEPALPPMLARDITIVAQVSTLKNDAQPSGALTTQILMTAEEHRANASTTRLGAGVTRAQNVTLLKAAQVAATKRLGQPNASKTKNVLAVAQARRQGKIQLQATLWTSRLTKKGIALIEVQKHNSLSEYELIILPG